MAYTFENNGKSTKKKYYVVEMSEDDAERFDPSKLHKAGVSKERKEHLVLKKLLLALPVIAILIIGGITAWNVQKTKQSDPIPASIKKSASFPLYYASKSPDGYHADKESVEKAPNIVSYNLADEAEKNKIAITQQPLPKDFDPKSMFGQQAPPSSIGKLGTIYDLSYKDQTRYMLVAPDTLIFISMNGKMSTEQLRLITDNLKPSTK